MTGRIEEFVQWFELHPLGALGLLVLLSWLANWLTKHILLRGLGRLVALLDRVKNEQLSPMRVIARLANVVPALVLSVGIGMIPGLPEALVKVVVNVSSAFVVLTIALAVGGALDLANALYERRPDAHRRPIKGYVQVLKIVVYVFTTILVIASLIDRSPLILLSGLGAMAAVLMLIFQDTLLSLVASVQLGSNDMVRVGDWIEMPGQNADGDVIDIALHTVKVQNWDKTITTIPTKRLISDSFKNWRGMQESGGRRIKRSLFLDQQSVRFLTDAEIARLSRFALLGEYLEGKRSELGEWNNEHADGASEEVNRRRLTNIGTFRAYVERYLRKHPGIHQGMTLMVRQLAPTAEGLPLELYCFTATTAWVAYEGIQADIFDHLLAVVPEFGLRVFQAPSGADMRTLGQDLRVVAQRAEAAAG
ncbi:mechanosensitive ion channel family protein [Pseudothauera nasutitermitis]|uniref:Mechanosensing system component YbdG n=1 Tax=Pseudothauera nasutitermitis TaxID=2565930 RepID=A0A4S4AM67_9RHOO|nr:mechanosensitive ion channel family protein [Pseudothauera nasutitermitis]THF60584.1 mechanosensitive ion channel family protein [Pseudothauera nasutitermitis]